jgi:phenylacetic acid degradation protein paaN
MANAQQSAQELFDRHRATLDQAIATIHSREFWSPYPESPSPRVYGDTAAAEGQAAYEAYLGKEFPIDQPATVGWVGDERSPYGPELGVRYPEADIAALLPAMHAAMPAWRDAGAQARAGVCLEILDRLNKASFTMASAVMHTSGQAFVMAFQAGGPQAQDRGLEAVAYAYEEMTRQPRSAVWEKPQGKRPPVRMEKTFHVVPRGIALVIGCNTFPTWNSYPGFIASLVTGNPVLVKPHPRATLPLAITVQTARAVLAEAGFDQNLVCLAAEQTGGTLAADLATRPEIRIIDFTGSTSFGEWLEANARQAQVYTEKAGVNAVVVDSTDDFRGMCANLAFSLSLYSGQMCTTPQNIFVPRAGITGDGEHKTFDDVVDGIGTALDALLGEDAKAVELLGAIANDSVRERLDAAASQGTVAVPSRTVRHPKFPDAVVRTPVIVRLDVDDEKAYTSECFGPVAFAIATDDTAQSIDVFRRTVSERGALTASVYSTDEKVLDAAEEAAIESGVALSCNLTGGVYVNQSAAYSDFHGTGANPAANAALTDGAYVAGRFRIVQSRRHLPA